MKSTWKILQILKHSIRLFLFPLQYKDQKDRRVSNQIWFHQKIQREGRILMQTVYSWTWFIFWRQLRRRWLWFGRTTKENPCNKYHWTYWSPWKDNHWCWNCGCWRAFRGCRWRKFSSEVPSETKKREGVQNYWRRTWCRDAKGIADNRANPSYSSSSTTLPDSTDRSSSTAKTNNLPLRMKMLQRKKMLKEIFPTPKKKLIMKILIYPLLSITTSTLKLYW